MILWAGLPAMSKKSNAGMIVADVDAIVAVAGTIVADAGTIVPVTGAIVADVRAIVADAGMIVEDVGGIKALVLRQETSKRAEMA